METTEKAQANSTELPNVQVEAQSEEAPANASASSLDQDDGQTIDDYAAATNLSKSEIWARLRAGKLVGRTHLGRLYIYDSPEKAAISAPQPTKPSGPDRQFASSSQIIDLPPLPDGDEDVGALVTQDSMGNPQASTEIALLLDHLSLAKEENREILRMTQQSIQQVSEMSDKMVAMKDQVIEAKLEQIQALEERLATREEAMRKLQQDNEDLETLVRTLS